MLQELNDESLLSVYANKYEIDELSKEDIIKLMTKPYPIKEIIKSFGITEKEFNELRKKKGITNVELENIIRNIETILHYFDSMNRYISQKVRKDFINVLISLLVPDGIPRKQFYIKKLSETNFSREKVLNDFMNNEIDFDYRIENLSSIIPYIEKLLENKIETEKNNLFNCNNKELCNHLIQEKKSGKEFNKNDLTYEYLFKLAITENIPDTLIANLFNMSRNEIRYLRKKHGLANKFKIKIKNYPEIIGYLNEKNNGIPIEVTNYEFEKIMINLIEKVYENDSETIVEENDDDIIVELDNEKVQYHVHYSNEKYDVKSKNNHRKSNGARHNYQKENETKRLHGKIGEQIALQAERKRLTQIGLGELANEVLLIAQVDEETTLDGLGYDLISFNENRERIFIEVKTSFGTKDKPFFISAKELELIQGLKEEYACKSCLIYYVLINGFDVTIKNIYPVDFNSLKLVPVLYKVE